MDEWIYNNEVINRHSLYSLCGLTLNAVSNRDYPNSNYFNPDIECLDMDAYEKNVLQKSYADHTVDAVIGISTYVCNQARNARLLLIELRMGYKNISNLSETEIVMKISHTKSLVNSDANIEQKSLFIFDNKVATRAKNWFNRQSRTCKDLRYCETCSVGDFPTVIKSISDFPYEPVHNTETIQHNVLPLLKETELGCFFRQVKYWCGKAEEYHFKNPSEFEHIKSVITDIWRKFKNMNYCLSDNEILELEIIEDDFEYLR